MRAMPAGGLKNNHNMKLRFAILFITLLLYFFPVIGAFAQGDYVLPYPGAMPGNRLYTISKIVDYIQSWWSFGNLSQFTYQLSMADKKLVEAKTLFEYKQYLLASDGLARYQSHLKKQDKWQLLLLLFFLSQRHLLKGDW